MYALPAAVVHPCRCPVMSGQISLPTAVHLRLQDQCFWPGDNALSRANIGLGCFVMLQPALRTLQQGCVRQLAAAADACLRPTPCAANCFDSWLTAACTWPPLAEPG